MWNMAPALVEIIYSKDETERGLPNKQFFMEKYK